MPVLMEVGMVRVAKGLMVAVVVASSATSAWASGTGYSMKPNVARSGTGYSMKPNVARSGTGYSMKPNVARSGTGYSMKPNIA